MLFVGGAAHQRHRRKIPYVYQLLELLLLYVWTDTLAVVYRQLVFLPVSTWTYECDRP